MTPVERSTLILHLLKAGPILESDFSKHRLRPDVVRRTVRALMKGGYRIEEKKLKKGEDRKVEDREYILKGIPQLSMEGPLRGPTEVHA